MDSGGKDVLPEITAASTGLFNNSELPDPVTAPGSRPKLEVDALGCLNPWSTYTALSLPVTVPAPPARHPLVARGLWGEHPASLSVSYPVFLNCFCEMISTLLPPLQWANKLQIAATSIRALVNTGANARRSRSTVL